MVLTIADLAIIAMPNGLLAQTGLSAKDNESYLYAKNALSEYGNVIDMDERTWKIKADLVGKGPPIIPVLVHLFGESSDDHYRTAIINTIFSIEGGEEQATRFVEQELNRDPTDWLGETWVFASLIRMQEVNPRTAARIAVRVLEHDKRLTQLAALSVLKKHGQAEQVEALEQFLDKRRRSPPPGGSLDGVAISAQEAIDAIRQRIGQRLSAGSPANMDQGGLTNPAASGVNAASRGIFPAPPGAKPVEEGGLRTKSLWRAWWVWAGIATGVVAAFLFFFVRPK